MTTELTPVQRAQEVLAFSAAKAELTDLAKQSSGITEITNKAGYDQCHAARMVLKNKRVSIQKTGKEAREDAQAYSRAVIAVEKDLVAIIEPEEGRLAAMQENWDTARQREKDEAERLERERVQAQQDALATITGALGKLFGAGVEQLNTAIEQLEAFDMGQFDEVFGPAAVQARDEALAAITKARDERLELDRQAAEIAQQRAEQAKAEAARAEQQAKEDAARKAQQEAEDRARAERQKAEDDERRAAAKAEQDRLAEERRKLDEQREQQVAAEREENRRRQEAVQREADEASARAKAAAEEAAQARAQAEEQAIRSASLRDAAEAALEFLQGLTPMSVIPSPAAFDKIVRMLESALSREPQNPPAVNTGD